MALEYRVMRILFYQGFLTRGRVSLKSYFYPQMVDVTDIDALGISFGSNFQSKTVLCECKSGKNGEIDRILWLAGLGQYFPASERLFVREQIAPKIKKFAEGIGVVSLDYEKLNELERQFEVGVEWTGSFDPDLYAKIIQYYSLIKENQDLNRTYWLVRSGFWYTDNTLRLKELLGRCAIISKYSDDPRDRLREASTWLCYESAVLLSVAILELCREVYAFSDRERPEMIESMLEYGIVSPEKQQQILRAALDLAASVVKERTGEPVMFSKELFQPGRPRYSDRLIDLAERLTERPCVAAEVPRFLDYFLYENLKGVVPSRDLLRTMFKGDIDMLAKMSKNVIDLMIKAGGVPEKSFQQLLTY